MFDDLELINKHVRSLFTHNAESRMLVINDPQGSTVSAPLLYLGRTQSGNIWRFHADVPDELCEELNALCADEPPADAEFQEPPRHLEAFVRLLETHAPVKNASNGLTYHFTEYVEPSRQVIAVTPANAEILRGSFDHWLAELPDWQPFVTLVAENRAASLCCSVCITPEAHQAGIETLPDFRGRGYAKEVAVGWAFRVRATGAIPLYTTGEQNTASQAVARKLGLRLYGSDFQIA